MLTLTHSPDFTALDLRTDLQPSTKKKYKAAWLRAIRKGVDLTDPDSIAAYAPTLSSSGKLFLSGMMKHQTQQLERAMKNGLNPADATPETVAKMQAAIWKLETLRDSIPTHKPKGEKSHLWLTPAQVEQLTSLPDRRTVSGRRDWVVLALLLSGLRCEEAETITFDRLAHRPMKNGQMRACLDVTGKGAKDRTVPIQPLMEKYLLEWKQETGDGRITRSVNKSGVINGSLSDRAIFAIVRKYGRLIGLPQLAPHDLRRTYAQIGWDETHNLIQVMTSLGHESPDTTKDYLNLEMNYDQAISDFVPLSGD